MSDSVAGPRLRIPGREDCGHHLGPNKLLPIAGDWPFDPRSETAAGYREGQLRRLTNRRNGVEPIQTIFGLAFNLYIETLATTGGAGGAGVSMAE